MKLKIRKKMVLSMVMLYGITLLACGCGNPLTLLGQSSGEQDSTQAETKKAKKIASNDNKKIDEALKKVRSTRKDSVVAGYQMGSVADEKDYGLDTSNGKYMDQLDTMEYQKAIGAVIDYVKKELNLDENSVWECIDPRVLKIYEDPDKGVAKGYKNENIWVGEYKEKNGTWKYIIAVRKAKGEPWKVIHHGDSYKK